MDKETFYKDYLLFLIRANAYHEKYDFEFPIGILEFYEVKDGIFQWENMQHILISLCEQLKIKVKMFKKDGIEFAKISIPEKRRKELLRDFTWFTSE